MRFAMTSLHSLECSVEIKHLRSFVTLAEELHFGRAAQRLSIVQPALSMQIKMLEEELGVRLFERNRHSVALTEVGTLFLPEARATLYQSAHAADVARRAGAAKSAGYALVLCPRYCPNCCQG